MRELGVDEHGAETRTLLVWDEEGTPPTGDWTTVLWSSFATAHHESRSVSIPQLVEEHAEELKGRYLGWIHDLGETCIGSRRIIDHLQLRSGFSYWWMTSLAQKFNASATSMINDAIKALALESLVSATNPRSIRLVSNNRKLAATLQRFCRGLDIDFEWTFFNESRKSINLRRLYCSLPYLLQALIYFLWYLFQHVEYRRSDSKSARAGGIAFVDVLVHLDRRAFTTGRFVSNYWSALVDKLEQWHMRALWLHSYYRHEAVPSVPAALRLIEAFNGKSRELQAHVLLESKISLRVLTSAARQYFTLRKASRRLTALDSAFQPAGSALNLWPLFEEEWRDSLGGRSAMVNCLCFSLFEHSFKELPPQKIGIYILENQPWEMALLYAWRAGGHGRIIGVPHTTVRYWDLRYFYDPRDYESTEENRLPLPDLVAVNGPVAKKQYLEAGYPVTQLTEVEALRYLYLENRRQPPAVASSLRTSLKVLVCGDFLAATTRKMLSWLAVAARTLPTETSYILKPHPAYAVDVRDFSSLHLKVSDALLGELLGQCDVIFTSNITSAAVDAYCAGIPVVQMLDGGTFNASPLRGLTGVSYVTDATELADALRNAQCTQYPSTRSYFFLDSELRRWGRLLDIQAASAA